MDKEILVVALLAAVILTSVIQTFQVVSFQSTVSGLKATGTIVGAAAAAGSGAPVQRSASSGVGGCG